MKKTELELLDEADAYHNQPTGKSELDLLNEADAYHKQNASKQIPAFEGPGKMGPGEWLRERLQSAQKLNQEVGKVPGNVARHPGHAGAGVVAGLSSILDVPGQAWNAISQSLGSEYIPEELERVAGKQAYSPELYPYFSPQASPVFTQQGREYANQLAGVPQTEEEKSARGGGEVIGGGFNILGAPYASVRGITQGAKNLLPSKQTLTGFSPELYEQYTKAGITPTLSEVSKSKVVKGVQNALPEAPFAAGVFDEAAERRAAELEKTTNKNLKLENAETVEDAGTIVSKGAQQFNDATAKKANHYYDPGWEKVNPNADIPLPKTLTRLKKLFHNLSDPTKELILSSSSGTIFDQLIKAIEHPKTLVPKEHNISVNGTKNAPVRETATGNQLTQTEKVPGSAGDYFIQEKPLMAEQPNITATRTKEMVTPFNEATGKPITKAGTMPFFELREQWKPRVNDYVHSWGKIDKTDQAILKQLYGTLNGEMKDYVSKHHPEGAKLLAEGDKIWAKFKNEKTGFGPVANDLIDKTPAEAYDYVANNLKKNRLDPAKVALSHLDKADQGAFKSTFMYELGVKDGNYSPEAWADNYLKLRGPTKNFISGNDGAKKLTELARVIKQSSKTKLGVSPGASYVRKFWDDAGRLGAAGTAGFVAGGTTGAALLGLGAPIGARVGAHYATSAEFLEGLYQASKAKTPKQLNSVLSKYSFLPREESLREDREKNPANPKLDDRKAQEKQSPALKKVMSMKDDDNELAGYNKVLAG